MSNYIYGVVNDNGEFIDTSKTERGAKNLATRNGYTSIGRRDVNHYYVEVIATKKGGRWV